MVRPCRYVLRSGPVDRIVLDPVRLDFADRLPLGSAPCPDRPSGSGTNPPTMATWPPACSFS